MTSATRCPICGETNDCGIAQGKESCWCFSTPVPPAVLDQVPDEQRNVVCVCRTCAERAGSSNDPKPAVIDPA